MPMKIRTRPFLSASLVIICTLVAAALALAHPPWNPFDDTRFAPITRFGPSVGIEVVARGDATNTLTSPLKAVAAPGLPNHIFIVDQPGILWAVDLSTTPPTRTKFLDVRPTSAMPVVIPLGVCGDNTFDERGLLGLAFHPQYQQNGKFYTYTSEVEAGPPSPPNFTTVAPGAADHQNVVSEWRAANPANPAAGVLPGRRQLIRANWPQFNHDGGDLAFGPDGMLYISMGDGGGADDADGQLDILARPKFPQTPTCSLTAAITGHQGDGNAQKLNTHHGKVHRIDVDGANSANGQYGIPRDNPFRTGPVPEIWAYGFRNPYRFSFDSRTGDLFLGDVGQNDIEEVSLIVRGGNFGWNLKEGTKFFHINGTNPGFASDAPDPARGPLPRGLIDPIAQYDTHHEGHSVIGGYVCHSCGIPKLRGKYVFGDFALLFKFPSGPHDYARLFAMNASGDQHGLRQISELEVLPGSRLSLALLGIGQDAQGKIYMTGNVSGVPFGNGGVVVRLVPAPEAETDDDRDD